MKRALDYDDVALVPQFNNIKSRTEPSLKTKLTRNVDMEVPILAANMDTVINHTVAKKLQEYGSIPIFHRFTSPSTQAQWVETFGPICFISTGLEGDLDGLINNCSGVCIDVAHGHSDRMLSRISSIKRRYPNKEVIAGNVCTEMAVQDLYNAGADAVKVGIGPGAACTTRKVTGFGIPQFTAVRDCSRIGKKLQIPIIADGGIKGSRELALALAAGASSVMCGSLFAACIESPQPGIIRGQSRGRDEKGLVIVDEGQKIVMTVTHFDTVMGELLGGLRSAMTYGGARTIEEFQRKAEFVRIR